MLDKYALLSKPGHDPADAMSVPNPQKPGCFIDFPCVAIGVIPDQIVLGLAGAIGQLLLPNIMSNIERLLVERGVIPGAVEETSGPES